MYCWYCGTKLPGAAAYCYRCGQEQGDEAEYDPNALPLAPDGWPWSRGQPAELAAAGASEAPVPMSPTDGGVPVRPWQVVVDRPPASGVAADASAAPRRTVGPAPSRVAGVLGILCGIAVVAGSLGPWVSARVLLRDPIHISGSEGDGRFTLWLGLSAVICLAALLASPERGGLGVAAAGAFFLAALIGIADWSNIADHFADLRRVGQDGGLDAEVGWGLQAVTLGGLAGAVLATIQALQARRVTG